MHISPKIRRHMRRVAAVTALACLAGTGVAKANPPVYPVTSTDQCTQPALSQTFLSIGDTAWYTLAPGGAFPTGKTTNGWTLSGGASIVSTTQADGTTGGVLDLPSKAQAVSPVMCVSAQYPTARLHVRNLVGSEGVDFRVSYYQNGVWTASKSTGQFHGTGTAWTLSNPMNVQPSNVAGWQLMKFTFIAGGTTSRFQADNFWVDPYRA